MSGVALADGMKAAERAGRDGAEALGWLDKALADLGHTPESMADALALQGALRGAAERLGLTDHQAVWAAIGFLDTYEPQ